MPRRLCAPGRPRATRRRRPVGTGAAGHQGRVEARRGRRSLTARRPRGRIYLRDRGVVGDCEHSARWCIGRHKRTIPFSVYWEWCRIVASCGDTRRPFAPTPSRRVSRLPGRLSGARSGAAFRAPRGGVVAGWWHDHSREAAIGAAPERFSPRTRTGGRFVASASTWPRPTSQADMASRRRRSASGAVEPRSQRSGDPGCYPESVCSSRTSCGTGPAIPGPVASPRGTCVRMRVRAACKTSRTHERRSSDRRSGDDRREVLAASGREGTR
jgi:hypothetical protein